MKDSPVNISDNRVWYVYILECCDGTFYTGITIDIKRREREHNGGSRGAKYTRIRRPVKMVFYKKMPDLRSAMKMERDIKKKSRKDKENIINHGITC